MFIALQGFKNIHVYLNLVWVAIIFVDSSER